MNNRYRTQGVFRGWRAALACSALIALTGCTSTVRETAATMEAETRLNAESLAALGNADALPTPLTRPAGAAPAVSQQASQPTIAEAVTETAEAATVEPGTGTPIAVAPTTTDDIATQRIRAAANAPTAAGPQVAAAAAPTPPSIVAGANAQPTGDRPGLLTALFSNGETRARPRAVVGQAETAPRPVIARASATAPPRPVIARASARGSTAALPGVSRDRALGIDRNEGAVDAPVQLASAGGLARLAPNGLRTQHAGVDVKCLKPALVRLLKRVESHYGKPVIVTSGYRSPARNRAARGAKNSLHMYCAAADIQVAGVSKWQLASYMRSIPGRGGVGTYCHTRSVHIDIGPKRDWNWRCRRRG